MIKIAIVALLLSGVFLLTHLAQMFAFAEGFRRGQRSKPTDTWDDAWRTEEKQPNPNP
jgi:hypothetical protein